MSSKVFTEQQLVTRCSQHHAAYGNKHLKWHYVAVIVIVVLLLPVILRLFPWKCRKVSCSVYVAMLRQRWRLLLDTGQDEGLKQTQNYRQQQKQQLITIITTQCHFKCLFTYAVWCWLHLVTSCCSVNTFDDICGYFHPVSGLVTCKNQPVSFPVPLTTDPCRLRCPSVTWVRFLRLLIANLNVSVCPLRRTSLLSSPFS